jgi:chromosome segregation ATPase
MKIQQPISKQTLMKSNAQLRRDDSDDEVPPSAAMPVGFPDMASSSHTVPPSKLEVNYAQIMEALAALQGGMSSMLVSMSSMQQSMCSMQQSISSMQLAVHSIDRRVEQNQLDLQECLKYHHPSSSDDEDVVDEILPMPEDV